MNPGALTEPLRRATITPFQNYCFLFSIDTFLKRNEIGVFSSVRSLWEINGGVFSVGQSSAWKESGSEV